MPASTREIAPRKEESRRGPLLTELRQRLFHFWFILSRPMTLGVRGLVHDRSEGTVLLIRHTYVPGWQLPGGGVEAGETAFDALGREMEEEANVTITAPPRLMSFHHNSHASRRDHVAFYLITEFERGGPKKPDMEIAEAGFFRLDDLPAETTPATKRRLAEVFDGQTPSPDW